jgi:hypothetical protein
MSRGHKTSMAIKCPPHWIIARLSDHTQYQISIFYRAKDEYKQMKFPAACPLPSCVIHPDAVVLFHYNTAAPCWQAQLLLKLKVIGSNEIINWALNNILDSIIFKDNIRKELRTLDLAEESFTLRTLYLTEETWTFKITRSHFLRVALFITGLSLAHNEEA